MPSTASPTMRPTRSFISRAALLVKVTARISDGQAQAGVDQMGEPRGQRRGLAGAGAGEHQHRPFGGQHRLALRRVEPAQIRGLGRVGLRESHVGEVGNIRGRGKRSLVLRGPGGGTIVTSPCVDLPSPPAQPKRARRGVYGGPGSSSRIPIQRLQPDRPAGPAVEGCRARDDRGQSVRRARRKRI